MRRGAIVLALLAAGCGGGHAAVRASGTATATPARGTIRMCSPPKASASPETGSQGATTSAPDCRATAVPVPAATTPAVLKTCPHIAHALCGTLDVPLDRSGTTAGTLHLPYAVTGPAGAPVLVLLSGGPGQPGLPFLTTFDRHLGAAAKRVRLAVIDQRGTGKAALRCPALQEQMGASDLTPPTEAAVSACASAIGDARRFYTTTDTVQDLDRLRAALGVDKLALDGVSYGSYVAERYALAYPGHTSRLVLDSVVPHAGVAMTSETPMQAVPRILGARAAAAIRTVVAARHDGPQILDMLTSLSIGQPHYTTAKRDLAEAAGGDVKPLNRLIAAVHRVDASFKATDLSQGLHAATLCSDTPAPWGDASAPAADREAKLAGAAAKVDTGPFDAATASGNGIALQCRYWPPEPVHPAQLPPDLPDVPTLILAGTSDLSTPLEWARAEAAHAPGAKLVTVAGAGHSIQSQQRPAVLKALAAFF
jgi:pimeloyl-ACP methyl ester carboxylesterase